MTASRCSRCKSSTKPKRRCRQDSPSIPNSAQAWYNLGLAQHAGNDLDGALKSFQQAAKIDPHDADSLYFVGACYQEMKQYDKAIAAFEQALAVNPIHASAEFGLARSLQRAGKTDEAREHFKRFQHLTSTKVSSAISSRLRRAGTLLHRQYSRRAAGHRTSHDSGKVDCRTDGAWHKRIGLDYNGRRLHDGRDRLRQHGPDPDAERPTGHSSFASGRR